MNIFELLFLGGMLALAWAGGMAVQRRYGLAVGVVAGMGIAAALILGWAMLTRRLGSKRD